MITEKETSVAGSSIHDVEAQPESVTERGPQTHYSHRGHIPPVAPLVDTALMPSASDRAFGEVGHTRQGFGQASSDVVVDEDASKSAGPTGSRFSGDGDLGDVERGLRTLKLGDTGLAVRRVQQSLFELNYRPISVNGTYDQVTADHVKAYQQTNKLTRQDGTLDSATFLHLEKQFFSLGRYAAAAKHAPPGVHDTPNGRDRKRGGTAIEPVLLEETHALDTEDKAEANRVINPVQAQQTAVGEFQQTNDKGTYGPRLEKLLLDLVDSKYSSALAKQKQHDHGATLSMHTLENIGNIAKEHVDSVFGSWAVGSPMKAGVNLFDRYEHDRAEQKHEKSDQLRKDAKARARYILNNEDPFHEIDQEHSADRSRTVEHEIVEKVVDRVAAAKEKELLLIIATSSAATERSGEIKLQRMRNGDEADDRWDRFGTLIHEYIHSIADPKWHAYRDRKGKTDPEAGNTLGEGVTELLTRTVVSQLNLADKNLRKRILGDVDDDGSEPDIRGNKYDGPYLRAHSLVGVVGIFNLYAAYFLGQTKLIGE